jgi:hypothetical protein
MPYQSILKIAPKQAKNTKGLCICDKCNNTFKPEEALTEKCNNVQFQGLFGIKYFTKGKNKWYLVSPCCKEIHLFGFEIKS